MDENIQIVNKNTVVRIYDNRMDEVASRISEKIGIDEKKAKNEE